MATRDEEHSTRGRAHMLFELLQGEVLRDRWNDEHVKKSLDLCLSCKACKSERRRRDLQGGISLALLRKQEAAATGTRVWKDRPLGATCIGGAANRQLFQPCSGTPAFARIDFGTRATAANTTICCFGFSEMGDAATPRSL
jgi:hypothetical protein